MKYSVDSIRTIIRRLLLIVVLVALARTLGLIGESSGSVTYKVESFDEKTWTLEEGRLFEADKSREIIGVYSVNVRGGLSPVDLEDYFMILDNNMTMNQAIEGGGFKDFETQTIDPYKVFSYDLLGQVTYVKPEDRPVLKVRQAYYSSHNGQVNLPEKLIKKIGFKAKDIEVDLGGLYETLEGETYGRVTYRAYYDSRVVTYNGRLFAILPMVHDTVVGFVQVYKDLD